MMNKMGNIERRDILSLELCGELAENYCAFADLVVSEDGEARFKWLEEKNHFHVSISKIRNSGRGRKKL